MRYMVLFEWNLVDMERINELQIQILKERDKGSDRWPKPPLLEPHYLEAEIDKKSRDMQGFYIIETDDPMHLLNTRLHLAPYLDINFIPITPNRLISTEWLATKREVFRAYLTK